jgi:hypothetical protein
MFELFLTFANKAYQCELTEGEVRVVPQRNVYWVILTHCPKQKEAGLSTGFPSPFNHASAITADHSGQVP